ncbi:unnamed protein product [Boreogadus saida]
MNRLQTRHCRKIIIHYILLQLPNTQKQGKTRIIKQASKTTSIQKKQFSVLHTQAVERKTNSILLDPSRLLHGCLELFGSGRRYRVPLAKTSLYKILHTQGNTHTQHTSYTSTT